MYISLLKSGPERPVLFNELVSGSLVSSSSVGNNNETLELPVVDEGSDVNSMPELEDATDSDTVEIPHMANTQWGYGNFPRRKGDL